MDRKEMLKRLEKGEDPLELSIEKWQDIVDGKDKGKEHGLRNCALCEKYCDTACKGCPISAKTSRRLCYETPYMEFSEAISENQPQKVLKRIAKKEVKFLKSLRKQK